MHDATVHITWAVIFMLNISRDELIHSKIREQTDKYETVYIQCMCVWETRQMVCDL